MDDSILGKWLSCNHFKRQCSAARGASKGSLPRLSDRQTAQGMSGFQAIDEQVCRIQEWKAANRSERPCSVDGLREASNSRSDVGVAGLPCVGSLSKDSQQMESE